MSNYLASDKAAADAAEAEIFAVYRDQIAATDPEAIAADGSIIGRNAATGELEPDATRTTGFYGEPQPAVQGFFHPVPEDEALQLADPTATGVEVTEHLNPWPVLSLAGEAPPLPEWVQPTGAQDAYPLGMWVTHQGADYESLLAANVWEPSPESNFWRISPDPGPLPWRQPSGSGDAYNTGDRVTHTVEGRETDLWESNIDANVYVPGDDVADRWWKPILDAGGEVLPWVQPMPGTANTPYEIGAKVTHNGSTWTNTARLNVWEPGVFGGMPDEPVRARNEQGQFVADDPATPDINEAWQ